MKAIQVARVGAPEVLTLVEVPVPDPKSNEALVQIKAAGVNFIDVYFREGRYLAPLPFINGQEAAGIVVAVGPDVTTLRLGDRGEQLRLRGLAAERVRDPLGRDQAAVEDRGDAGRDDAAGFLE